MLALLVPLRRPCLFHLVSASHQFPKRAIFVNRCVHIPLPFFCLRWWSIALVLFVSLMISIWIFTIFHFVTPHEVLFHCHGSGVFPSCFYLLHQTFEQIMCSVTPTLLAAVFAVGEFLFCPCLASLSVFHPTMVLVQQKEQGERLVTSGENFTDRSRQPSSPESTQLWVDRSENPIDEISEIVFNFG